MRYSKTEVQAIPSQRWNGTRSTYNAVSNDSLIWDRWFVWLFDLGMFGLCELTLLAELLAVAKSSVEVAAINLA